MRFRLDLLFTGKTAFLFNCGSQLASTASEDAVRNTQVSASTKQLCFPLILPLLPAPLLLDNQRSRLPGVPGADQCLQWPQAGIVHTPDTRLRFAKGFWHAKVSGQLFALSIQLSASQILPVAVKLYIEAP